MTRHNRSLAFLLVGVAAACGDSSAPKPAPTPPAPQPAAPDTPPSVTNPPAPEPAPAAPQPAPAPAGHATKDAKGHDWASHMGDVAFTFDSAEAATRAKKEGRVAMMYFTSPT